MHCFCISGVYPIFSLFIWLDWTRDGQGSALSPEFQRLTDPSRHPQAWVDTFSDRIAKTSLMPWVLPPLSRLRDGIIEPILFWLMSALVFAFKRSAGPSSATSRTFHSVLSDRYLHEEAYESCYVFTYPSQSRIESSSKKQGGPQTSYYFGYIFSSLTVWSCKMQANANAIMALMLRHH